MMKKTQLKPVTTNSSQLGRKIKNPTISQKSTIRSTHPRPNSSPNVEKLERKSTLQGKKNTMNVNKIGVKFTSGMRSNLVQQVDNFDQTFTVDDNNDLGTEQLEKTNVVNGSTKRSNVVAQLNNQECFTRSTNLEIELAKLQLEISNKDAQIELLQKENIAVKKTVHDQKLEIEKLKENLSQHVVADDPGEKNKQIVQLEHEKLVLDVKLLKKEMKELSGAVSTASAVQGLVEEKPSDLEKETSAFLEKVSNMCNGKCLKMKALSKDQNVKISLKVAVRNTNIEKGYQNLDFCKEFNFNTPNVLPNTPCQRFTMREDYDNIFTFPDTPLGLSDNNHEDNLLKVVLRRRGDNISDNGAENFNPSEEADIRRLM